MASNTFLMQQLTSLENQLSAINEAIVAIGTGKVQEYTLDTGQTKETVKRIDLDKLTAMFDSRLNQYTVLCARLNYEAAFTGVPDY